jgi:hypothetical protein
LGYLVYTRSKKGKKYKVGNNERKKEAKGGRKMENKGK